MLYGDFFAWKGELLVLQLFSLRLLQHRWDLMPPIDHRYHTTPLHPLANNALQAWTQVVRLRKYDLNLNLMHDKHMNYYKIIILCCWTVIYSIYGVRNYAKLHVSTIRQRLSKVRALMYCYYRFQFTNWRQLSERKNLLENKAAVRVVAVLYLCNKDS